MPLSASCSDRTTRWPAVAAIALTIAATPADARVLSTVEDALERAFPAPARIEKKTLYLDAQQVQRIEARAGGGLPSRIATCFVARAGEEGAGQVIGYACLDTHIVRTLPETVLVVVDPEMRVVRTEVLAFKEPREYLPSDRWLAQFDGRPLEDSLQLKRDIHVLSGATLTSRAIMQAVRRVLAIVEVALAEGEAIS